MPCGTGSIAGFLSLPVPRAADEAVPAKKSSCIQLTAATPLEETAYDLKNGRTTGSHTTG
ncbi:MAG: hypothetical protein FWG01_04455 [Betaproteobacteria bacterium]|nr:hypothetical protein [Betaproteobacteria bacterium]